MFGLSNSKILNTRKPFYLAWYSLIVYTPIGILCYFYGVNMLFGFNQIVHPLIPLLVSWWFLIFIGFRSTINALDYKHNELYDIVLNYFLFTIICFFSICLIIYLFGELLFILSDFSSSQLYKQYFEYSYKQIICCVNDIIFVIVLKLSYLINTFNSIFNVFVNTLNSLEFNEPISLFKLILY